MSRPPSDEWSPGGGDSLTQGRTVVASEQDAKTLKGMLADAMAKSRGQGVVQGSTLFFKNLADSVAHSNRNLKIGLAFLTAAFVVVVSGLGYLVYHSFQTQVETKQSLQSQMASMNEETRKAVQPIVDRVTELDARVNQLETTYRNELATLRMNADRQIEAARAAAAAAQAKAEGLEEAVKIHDGYLRTEVPGAITKLDSRLKQLESRP